MPFIVIAAVCPSISSENNMHTRLQRMPLLKAHFAPQIMIDCYRMTFNNLLPNPGFQPYNGTRSEVVKKLSRLFRQFYSFKKILEANGRIEVGKMILFQQELKAVLSRHFSSSLVGDFFYKNQQIDRNQQLNELVRDLFDNSLKGYTQSEKVFYIKQYNKLFDTIHCITRFGLHPLIDERHDGECRFNVILEYKSGRNTGSVCRTTIEKEELFNDVISPFCNQKQMVINGRKVPSDKQVKLTVTVTKFHREEMPLFYLKNKIKDEYSFIKLGFDVTNHVIDEFKKQGTQISQIVQPPSEKFINKICSATETLQLQGKRWSFISDGIEKGEHREDQYRECFYAFFKGGDFNLVEAESLKETRRADLRLMDNKRNGYIMEFKGWWNGDCKKICQQILGYLDDFFLVGVAFVIDHLKEKYIEQEYRKFVEDPSSFYIPGSWKEKTFNNTHFVYYESSHKKGDKIKTIYHIIYRLHSKTKL